MLYGCFRSRPGKQSPPQPFLQDPGPRSNGCGSPVEVLWIWAIRRIWKLKKSARDRLAVVAGAQFKKVLDKSVPEGYRIGAADSRPYDVLLARAHEEIRQ
jgi:hypothetical protein